MERDQKARKLDGKCPFCVAIYPTNSMLRKFHLKHHSEVNKSPSVCECGWSCSNERELRLHQQVLHSKDKKDVPNQDIRWRSEILLHKDYGGHVTEKTTTDTDASRTSQYRCRFCEESFQNVTDHEKHLLSAHFNMHLCGICNRQFSHQNMYKLHMLKMHARPRPVIMVNTRRKNGAIKLNSGSKVLISAQTSMSRADDIESNSLPIEPLQKEDQAIHKSDDATLTRSPGKLSSQIDQNEAIIKSPCSQTTSLLGNSNEGLVEVVSPKPLLTCEEKFDLIKQTFNLDDSKDIKPQFPIPSSERGRTVHFDDRRQTMCRICRRNVSSLSYKNHIQRHIRIHMCKICPAAFEKAKDLNRHKEAHQIEKPSICIICDWHSHTLDELFNHVCRLRNYIPRIEPVVINLEEDAQNTNTTDSHALLSSSFNEDEDPAQNTNSNVKMDLQSSSLIDGHSEFNQKSIDSPVLQTASSQETVRSPCPDSQVGGNPGGVQSTNTNCYSPSSVLDTAQSRNNISYLSSSSAVTCDTHGKNSHVNMSALPQLEAISDSATEDDVHSTSTTSSEMNCDVLESFVRNSKTEEKITELHDMETVESSDSETSESENSTDAEPARTYVSIPALPLWVILCQECRIEIEMWMT